MFGFRIPRPLFEVPAPLFGTDIRDNFLVFIDAKSADEVNQEGYSGCVLGHFREAI